MVVWACNPNNEEGKEGRSGVQSQPTLHREMKATKRHLSCHHGTWGKLSKVTSV